MAMEDVAGTAEKLAKDKAAQAPPPPFRQRATQSIYSRIYSEDGREARNKRAEQRRMRATGIEKLGEEEYKKLLQEIDRMTQTPVNMQELIDKCMKEILERLEAEEKQKDKSEKRPKQRKTAAIPMIEDDDDDLEILDKPDEIHEPEEEEEEDDENGYPIDDDNDDDFQEPAPENTKT